VIGGLVIGRLVIGRMVIGRMVIGDWWTRDRGNFLLRLANVGTSLKKHVRFSVLVFLCCPNQSPTTPPSPLPASGKATAGKQSTNKPITNKPITS
jgi:hypothetical protein